MRPGEWIDDRGGTHALGEQLFARCARCWCDVAYEAVEPKADRRAWRHASYCDEWPGVRDDPHDAVPAEPTRWTARAPQ